MKIVFSDPKSGDSFQKEVEKSQAAQLLGKKIGDQIPGALAGLDGYTLKITGGSTNDGTPMRQDIPASKIVHALLPCGPGINEKKYLEKGMRIKKRVAGQTINERTAQLNAVISQIGAKSLTDLGFAGKNAAKTAEKQTKANIKEQKTDAPQATEKTADAKSKPQSDTQKETPKTTENKTVEKTQ